jgi:predicted DNA-binding ribbon-helix-helix protein
VPLKLPPRLKKRLIEMFLLFASPDPFMKVSVSKGQALLIRRTSAEVIDNRSCFGNQNLNLWRSIPRSPYRNRLYEDTSMKSSVAKRSIVIDGHKTSVSLEDAFWDHLKTIAHVQRVTLSKLVAMIDETRQHANLSSAIRLFVLDHFRTQRTECPVLAESGHDRSIPISTSGLKSRDT